jgi:hypothetical protein
MKIYIYILLALINIFNLNAEGFHSNRRSNPNYKNLIMYVKILERYDKSDFYLAQIDFENTGNSTVSFWETTSGYNFIFTFCAYGITFLNIDQRQYVENKMTSIPERLAVKIRTDILPHAKYTIKTQIYIFNREQFLKNNKNLRLEFRFNDANLVFMEDPMSPSIMSEDTIDYKW